MPDDKDKAAAQVDSVTAPPAPASAPAVPDAPAAEDAPKGFKVEAPGTQVYPDAVSAEAAEKQRAEDQKWRDENPNEPLVRGANPDVGGEGA